eukprot:jgi/Chrpa1/23489/Chrysochromulina_OHIO_Genome00027411-RA
MLNSGLSRGWGAWVAMAVERAEVMRKLRKGLSRMINRQLALGMASMRAFATNSALILQLARDLGHLVHCKESRAWRTWLSTMVVWAESLRKLRMGVRKMINHKLDLGFDRWYELWIVLKAERESMRKSLGFMLNFKLSQAWGAWAEIALDCAEVMRKLRKSLSFMINRKVALGFAGWLAAIAHVRKQRERVEETARRAIKSMWLQSLQSATNTWVAISEARQRAQQALHSAASAFRGFGMRKAWNGWLGLLHDRQMMASAFYCWTHHLQRTGFASWLSSTVVSAMKQQLRQTLSCLSPTKRSMRKAINSWSEYGYTMWALSRGAAALRLRKECVAFSTWHEHICIDGERQAAMWRAVASMIQSSLRASLNTWMSYAEEHVEASRVLADAMSSLQPEGHVVHIALNIWVGIMVQRRSMVVALAKLTKSEQMWGLHTWRAHAALVRRQRERVEETARRAIKSMLLQSLRAAMNAWVAISEARQRAQQALLSAASGFRNVGLHKAWNGWLGLLHDRQMREAQRGHMMKALLHLTNHELSRGWSAWCLTWAALKAK